jgi:nucleotide-binding universal stress UspA family protein
MFKRVLISLDDSALSRHAAHVGLALAQRLNSSVILCHVLDETGHATLSDPEASGRISRAHAERLLQPWLSEAASLNVSINIRLEPGQDVAEAIIRVAEDERAELIVIGTNVQAGLRGVLLDGTAYHVAHHAQVPVLLVRTQTKPEPIKPEPNQHILVAIKDLNSQGPVVAAANELIGSPSTKLTVLHVVPDPVPIFGAIADSDKIHGGRSERLAHGKKILEAALEGLDHIGAISTLLEAQGQRPGEVIVETAERIGANLIVIGGHQFKHGQRTLSSTLESVLHQASTSVLLVLETRIEPESETHLNHSNVMVQDEPVRS